MVWSSGLWRGVVRQVAVVREKYPCSIFFVRMSATKYSAVQQLGQKGICCFVLTYKSLYDYFNGKHPIVL
jgi:hypothetical protein